MNIIPSMFRQDANKHVSVPDSVKELIISLRNFLQDTCEPPVYVSDRRLLKSVALLKVKLWLGAIQSSLLFNLKPKGCNVKT